MVRRRRQPQQPAQPIQWHFFTWPVIFAFCLGALLATVLYPFGPIVFVVSLFGVSFGAAHMIGASMRRRGADRREEQAEEEERERRALIAREAAAREGEAASAAARRRRRRRNT
jgi:hypothetical protein